MKDVGVLSETDRARARGYAQGAAGQSLYRLCLSAHRGAWEEGWAAGNSAWRASRANVAPEPCSCEEALALRGLLAAVLAGEPGAHAEARAALQRTAAFTDSAGPAEDAALAQMLADPPDAPADQVGQDQTAPGRMQLEQPTDEDPELVCTEVGPCRFHADQPELLLMEKCPGYCPVGGPEGCRDGIGCEEAGMCHAHAAQWHNEQAGLL